MRLIGHFFRSASVALSGAAAPIAGTGPIEPVEDRIFLLDGFASVTDLMYAEMKTLAQRYVCGDLALDPLLQPFGVAVLRYSRNADVAISYRVITTPAEAMTFCQDIASVARPFGGSSTDMAVGLQEVIDLMASVAQAPVRQLYLFSDGDSSENPTAQSRAFLLRTMPQPVRICSTEFSDCSAIFPDCCRNHLPLIDMANDVHSPTYDPAQPTGRYACTGGFPEAELLCEDCVCGSDCNGNGILDVLDVLDGGMPDCNDNVIPDDCDLARGFALDCNANGIPDSCDIDGPVSLDCNGNQVPDDCELAAGIDFDCNVNGILDSCEIAAGASDCDGNLVPDDCEDCNANGLADDCDLTFTFLQESPSLPLQGLGVLASYTIIAPPSSLTDVTVTLTASAPLDAAGSSLTMLFNGQLAGVFSLDNGEFCQPVVDSIIISAADFNSAVAGGDVVFDILGNSVFSQGCTDPFVRIDTTYDSGDGLDVNGNGLPDECDRARGDSNLDGMIGILDFLAVLATWGVCDDPSACPSDADGDGQVAIEDFLIVLMNWGPA